VKDAEEVAANWEAIKQEERQADSSIQDGGNKNRRS
jgi:hypothetical protein